MWIRLVTVVLGMGVVSDTTAAFAQRSRCDSCLTLVPVVHFSSSDGPIVPSLTQSVLRTSDGRWLVSHLFIGQAHFVEYGPTGRFMGVRGRAGQGPGEFRGPPRLFPGPGNTIWAFDRNRLVRFDARLQHIATTDFSQGSLGGSNAFVLRSGTVVSEDRMQVDGTGFTIVLLDTTGAVIRRLESHSPESRTSTIITPSVDDGFWVMETNQPVLRRYSGTGELMRTVRLVIDQVTPWRGESNREVCVL